MIPSQEHKKVYSNKRPGICVMLFLYHIYSIFLNQLANFLLLTCKLHSSNLQTFLIFLFQIKINFLHLWNLLQNNIKQYLKLRGFQCQKFESFLKLWNLIRFLSWVHCINKAPQRPHRAKTFVNKHFKDISCN